jgi:hypothetical protein
VIDGDFIAVFTGFNVVFTEKEQPEPTDGGRQPIDKNVQRDSPGFIHPYLR